MNGARARKMPGFVLDKEKIRRTRDWPADSKLQWLEEALQLVGAALDERKRRVWEKFRKGEL